MQQKNRVLSLIDFSEYSETILRYTKSFSDYLQAEVVLIHQLPGIVPARASARIREQVYNAEREDANERLVELAGPLFEKMPPLLASQTELTATLHNLKNDAYYDWLFIGLKGTSLLEQIFLGSKAVEVLDETDFVTLAFPLNREIAFPEELVIAFQGEYEFDSDRLRTVLAQLSGRIRKIRFLTVATDKKEKPDIKAALSWLTAEFADLAADPVVFEGSNVQKEIERYMQDKPNSFLVLQQSDPALRDQVFKRGLVNELLYKSIVPMIVLPFPGAGRTETNAPAG